MASRPSIHICIYKTTGHTVAKCSCAHTYRISSVHAHSTNESGLKDLGTLFWVCLSKCFIITYSALQLPHLISPHLYPDLFTLPFLLFMSSVNNQEHQDPVMQQLKLHCKILKIDNQVVMFWCNEYRKQKKFKGRCWILIGLVFPHTLSWFI